MITGFYTGILAFILLALMLRIITRRWKYRVGLGHGGISDLEQAIRAHGNFIEVVPIILIIMFLMEQSLMPHWFIHIYGSLLIVSRLLHLWGLSKTASISFGRFYGTILILSLLAIGGASLIFIALK